MRTYKWSDEDIVHFCEPLSELLDGGMSLLDALTFLSTQMKARTKKILASITEGLKMGLPFSSALAIARAPSLFISIIVCSEQNNELVYALKTVSEHYEQRLAWRRKWQQITIYPLFIIITVTCCLLFLLIVVLPHFKGMYESLNVTIPDSLLLLIATGEWVKYYGLYLIISLIVVFLLFFICYSHIEQFRRRIIEWLLKTPLISTWLKLHYTQHVAFQMGFLLRSRLDILSVIALIEEYSASLIIKQQMNEMKMRLVNGQSLSQSMSQTVYREDFCHIIETGENAGKLAEMIVTYATNLKSLSYRRITALTRVMEPALIVGIGAFIGVVIMMLFMPVFGIINEL